MVKGRNGRCLSRRATVLLLVPVLLAAGYVAFRVLESGDRFVMVTVEESSTSAVTAWPLLSERLPDVFIDCASSTLMVQGNVGLLGARLGLYYSASSQGIEVKDSISFSRTGRTTVDLSAPISQVVEGLDGVPVEMVNNGARVVAGDLKVEKTSRDGTVYLAYGDRRFSLKPGESWVEMLALTSTGARAISAGNWQAELQSCLDNGYPATRLAVTNRGFWPKEGVNRGSRP